MTNRPERPYDQSLLTRGATLGYRVDEPVPFCWMCDAVSGKRSDEHIFPQWMQKALGMERAMITPVHESRFGDEISRRGPIPLSNLVNGQVCALCNNGWMASLESSFQTIFQGDRAGPIAPDTKTTMARWFAKTAIVPNTCQNYRLLYPAGARQQARRRVPANVSIWLARRSEDTPKAITWAQSSVQLMAESHESQIAHTAARCERRHSVAIEVADLIALVLYTPGGKVEPMEDLVPLWPLGRQIGWSDVPVTSTALTALSMVV